MSTKKDDDISQGKIAPFGGNSKGAIPKLVSLALSLIPSRAQFVLRRSFEFSSSHKSGISVATDISELESHGLDLLSDEVQIGEEVSDEEVNEALRALRGHTSHKPESSE